jgi:hypothetical protein
MVRRVVLMKLICSLGHCECDSHTVDKLCQRRLTADRLAPRESDCSRMHSKVSSDWMPIYIKDTQTVLKMFKMAGYFPGTPRIVKSTWVHTSTNSIRLRGGPISKKATLLTIYT